MNNLSSCLLTYFINIPVLSYFPPDVGILDFCTIIEKFVTSDNDLTHRLRWFHNVFAEVMVDFFGCSSDGMDSPCETEATECSILAT